MGTLLFEWSFVPKSHAGSFKEDRLISISPIERASSTPDGSFNIARITITVTDEDELITDLLTNEETEYWDGREGEICLLSDEGLEAGLEPWILMRGRLGGLPTLLDDRIVSFELIDVVGSEFSAFNLDKDLAIPIGNEHTNIPAGLAANYNIVYGEHSDVGSKDANGNPTLKGLIPGIYVGMYDIDPDNDPVAAPAVIPRPTNLHAEVIGGGSKTYHYAASVITPYGESMISDVITVTGCPDDDEFDLSNYVKLRCDFDAGTGNRNKIRWWGRYTKPPSGYLDESFYGYGEGTDQPDRGYYNDGSHPAPNPSRIDIDRVKKLALPKSATAAVASDTHWGRVVVAIGVVEIIGTPLASNLAAEAAPIREAMATSLEGVEYILPTSPQWPYADPWIEVANTDGETFRCTVVLIRGPRLQHHIDGAVTIAFNVCGYKGQNGLLINQAFLQLQSFFNEFVLKSFGKGYRAGDFGPLETFMDGSPILWTRKFQEAQDVSKILMGNSVGFEGAFNVNQSMTLREFIRRHCVTYGHLFHINHHGQPFPTLPTTNVPLTVGRLYRYPIEIETMPGTVNLPDQRQNKVTFTLDWDSDQQVYRFIGEQYMAQNTNSQDAHGVQGIKKVFQKEVKELWCTRHLDTAIVAMTNFVNLYRKTVVHNTINPDFTALHDELGDRVRFQHWNSLRPSGTTQLLVLRHVVTVNPGEESVFLTGMDMNRVAP